ncbi:hypothetical protein [Tenacibaculum sp. IB213877]|uniref:hypothetical protein n=1 Tax=Tenacibaculum sp. IB213877 TaxID=3097351 RepID=UPI002A5AF339|nr:hypothetical protein [Tenacibaculum sp. IB213877]MDY0781329.1 hypothetical protein [Tenacibaculum sp. IB213877]
MKKIIYLLTVITLFSNCNPLEDVNEIVDAIPEEPNVGSFEYKLTDDDYEALELNYGNFNSEDDAKEILPEFLLEKYSLYGEGSDATITFNIYEPKFTERSLKVYEVTDQDYTDNGHTYGNFDSFTDISSFLDVKYPDAPHRMLVSLTYKYYDGSVSTLENGFIKINDTWEMVSGITDDEYFAMGESYTNFSDEDEALVKIPVYLNDKFKYEPKEDGDIEGVMYKLYVKDTEDIDEDGSVDDNAVYSFIAYFVYDGMNWSQYTNEVEGAVKFAHNGTTWVPDNTIRHTLSGADFAFIGDAFANESGYEDAASSAARYGNFDRRDGEAAYWSDEMILNAISKLIDESLNPSAEEGQKYVITYAIYDGNSGEEVISIIKENGLWIYNEE